jgi:hypothetical protein
MLDDKRSSDDYLDLENIYASYYLRNPMNIPNYLFYKDKHGKEKDHVIYKRYDKQMGSYCSSHETGLALALYSLSIRYNLQIILDNY